MWYNDCINNLKGKKMKVIVQTEWFSLEQCAENPNNLYVFGDNLQRKGTGGQATIRFASNSFGIVTKRKPNNNPDAFFSDKSDEEKQLAEDVNNLIETIKNSTVYDTVVLPADGLGTGLSEMPTRSPFLFKWLSKTLASLIKEHSTN